MEKPFVLVADDNEATCTLLVALLQNDFRVEVAHDGQDAIDALKRRNYAALLLDLRMPVADGYAVLDSIAAQRPEFLKRVLVVTASLARGEMERVRKYDIAGVLAKPFEVETLQAAVRQCAGLGGEGFLAAPLISGSMLLLLADLLRRV